MKTSVNGLNFISNWEGCILHVYNDIAGKPTIGIGHLILPNERFTVITKQEALDILANDLAKCEKAIEMYIKVPLNQNQYDTLISFSFNCGTQVLATSTLAIRLNNGFYDEVTTHLRDWCKYVDVENGKKVLKINQGLLNRRISEGELWNTPVNDAIVNGNGILSDSEINNINNMIYSSLSNLANYCVETTHIQDHDSIA